MTFTTLSASSSLLSPGAQVLSFINNYNASSGSDTVITEVIPIGYEFLGTKSGSNTVTYTLTYNNVPTTANVYKNGVVYSNAAIAVVGGGSTGSKVFTNSVSGSYICNVYLMTLSISYTLPLVSSYQSSDSIVIYVPLTYSLSCSDIFGQNDPPIYGYLFNTSTASHNFSNMSYYTGSSDETGFSSASTTRNLTYSPTISPQNITNGFCYFNSGNFNQLNTYTGNISSTTVSTSTSTGALVVSGGVGIGGKISPGSITTAGVINTTNNTASTSTTTGALLVSGGAGIGGALYSGSVNTSGVINTSNNTASTSTSTGALLVSGGAGIAGSLYANALFSNGVFQTSIITGLNINTGSGGGGSAYTLTLQGQHTLVCVYNSTSNDYSYSECYLATWCKASSQTPQLFFIQSGSQMSSAGVANSHNITISCTQGSTGPTSGWVISTLRLT